MDCYILIVAYVSSSYGNSVVFNAIVFSTIFD